MTTKDRNVMGKVLVPSVALDVREMHLCVCVCVLQLSGQIWTVTDSHFQGECAVCVYKRHLLKSSECFPFVLCSICMTEQLQWLCSLCQTDTTQLLEFGAVGQLTMWGELCRRRVTEKQTGSVVSHSVLLTPNVRQHLNVYSYQSEQRCVNVCGTI